MIETLYGHGYRINPAFLRSPSPDDALSDDQVTELHEATAHIWQQIQASVLKQVGELEGAIATLTPQSWTPDTAEAARTTAHQIAGTVGTFGFDAASHITRAIESLLDMPSPWTSKHSLSQLVTVLWAELDHD